MGTVYSNQWGCQVRYVIFFVIVFWVGVAASGMGYERGIEQGRAEAAAECSTWNKFEVGTASFDCFEEE